MIAGSRSTWLAAVQKAEDDDRDKDGGRDRGVEGFHALALSRGLGGGTGEAPATPCRHPGTGKSADREPWPIAAFPLGQIEPLAPNLELSYTV